MCCWRFRWTANSARRFRAGLSHEAAPNRARNIDLARGREGGSSGALCAHPASFFNHVNFLCKIELNFPQEFL
jgi:hypothetical protein